MVQVGYRLGYAPGTFPAGIDAAGEEVSFGRRRQRRHLSSSSRILKAAFSRHKQGDDGGARDSGSSSGGSGGGSSGGEGRDLVVVGWGATEANKLSGVLLAAEVQPVGQERCREEFQQFGSMITPRMVCMTGPSFNICAVAVQV